MAKKNSIVDYDAVRAIIDKYAAGGSITREEAEMIVAGKKASPELDAYWNHVRRGRSGTGRSNTRNMPAQDGGSNVRGNLNQRLVSQSSGFGANRVVSPGGFKKSGLDADSQSRMAGGLTRGFNPVRFENDGSVTFEEGRGFPRRITKAEKNAVIARGTTGATLSVRDQMIYDAWIAQKQAAAKAAADAEAKRKTDEAALASAKAADAADLVKRRRDLEDALARKKFEEDYKAAAKEKERIRMNRALGVDDDVFLTPGQRKGLDEKRLRYDYSDKDKKEMERINAELDDIDRRDDVPEAMKKSMRRDAKESLSRYRKGFHENPDAPTTGPIIREMDGVKYLYKGKDGRGAEIWDPMRPEKKDDSEANRRKKIEDYASRFFTNNLKQTKRDEADQEVPAYTREEAMDLAISDAKDFIRRIEQQGVNPHPAPVAPPPVPDLASTLSPLQAGYGSYGGWQNIPAKDGVAAPAAPLPAEPPAAPVRPQSSIGSDWRDIPARTPAPVQTSAVQVPAPVPGGDDGEDTRAFVPGSETDIAETRLCPVCGAQLSPDGTCPVCGYPRNGEGAPVMPA